MYFIRMEAEVITEVFEQGEIARIYLNFSDPWPKDRHAKRRLPSREFLRRYDVILDRDGQVEFKTDNRELFDFALEETEPAGWQQKAVTFDLHHDAVMNEGNVMTEYEERFSSKGKSDLQIHYHQKCEVIFLWHTDNDLTQRKEHYGVHIYNRQF